MSAKLIHMLYNIVVVTQQTFFCRYWSHVIIQDCECVVVFLDGVGRSRGQHPDSLTAG